MFAAAFVCNRYKLMCTASTACVAKKLCSNAVLLLFYVLHIMASVMVSSRWHLTLQTSPPLWLVALALPMCSFKLSRLSAQWAAGTVEIHRSCALELRLVYFFFWLAGNNPFQKKFCCSSKLICPLCQSKQPLFNFLHEMRIICFKRVQILFTMARLTTSA